MVEAPESAEMSRSFITRTKAFSTAIASAVWLSGVPDQHCCFSTVCASLPWLENPIGHFHSAPGQESSPSIIQPPALRTDLPFMDPAEVDSMRTAIAQQGSWLGQHTAQLSSTNREIDNLTTRVADLTACLDQPRRYVSERTKVAYVITRLVGKAHDWATAVWDSQDPCCRSFEEFRGEMEKLFDRSVRGDAGCTLWMDLSMAFRMRFLHTNYLSLWRLLLIWPSALKLAALRQPRTSLSPRQSQPSPSPVLSERTCLFRGQQMAQITHCTTPVPAVDLTGVPAEYANIGQVFSKARATSLPPHWPYDCAINLLPGTTPPKGRLYSLSGPEREAMDKYINDALRAGLIRPSTSPAGAGFFFVKKKDGSLRPCIDYRGLNDVTVKNLYPLPLMSSAFELLQGAQFFTKLDLRNAYHLVRIREGDEWKTAFNTPTGHFEYCVLPFGLTNALSVFQALVNDVLRDMIDTFVFVYLDDILIFSPSMQEHTQHVRRVLRRLLENQLYVKAEKCEFHQKSVSFLGFVIAAGEIRPDPAKVKAVTQWPVPVSRKELLRFLGFTNFYWRFIRNYSQVAQPLTALPQLRPGLLGIVRLGIVRLRRPLII
nr:uncharacterized protein LOC129453092 [Misgurnus anguillicaudatus]